MRKFEKLIAWVAALVMVFSVFPVQAFAAGGGSGFMGPLGGRPDFVVIDSKTDSGKATVTSNGNIAQIISGASSTNGKNKVAAIWSEKVIDSATGKEETYYYVSFATTKGLNQQLNPPEGVNLKQFSKGFVFDTGTEQIDFGTPGAFTGKGTDLWVVFEVPKEQLDSIFGIEQTAENTINLAANAGGFTIACEVNAEFFNEIAEDLGFITVKAPTAEKMYDGKALTAEGLSYTVSGLQSGDELVLTGVSVSGSQTDAGNSDSKITYTSWKVMRGSKDVTTSYKGCVPAEGKLTVTPRSVTLTSASATKGYDGTPLTAKTVTESGDGFVAGEGYTANVTGSRTDIGTSENTFTYTLNSNTKPGNYKITQVLGTLEVKEASSVVVYVTGATDTRTYNGKEQSVMGYTLSCDSPLFDKSKVAFNGSAVAKGTDVSTYYMGLASSQFSYSDNNLSVTFEIEDGWLQINESTDEIVVETVGGEKEYDGTLLAGSVKDITVPTGYTVQTAGTNVSVTHVSDKEKKVTVDTLVIVNAKGEDVTGKLNITKIETATVKITPATLVVTTESADKPYDGTALTAGGKIEGFKNNETATFTVTGSRTEIGSDTNTYTLVFDQTAEETDYTVEKHLGTLEVTSSAIEVEVIGEVISTTYDGTEYTATAVTFVCDSELFDESKVVYTPKKVTSTDVVTKTGIGYSEDDFSYSDGNVKVVFKVTDGSLEIKPASYYVETASGSKVYDGKELTNATATVKGLVNGETATVSANGTITDVGSTKNNYEYISWTGAKASNYVHGTDVIGTLTVTKAEMVIKITGKSDTKTYNGKEQSVTGYKLSSDNELFDETLVTFSGDATAKGTNVDTYPMGLDADDFSYGDTDNFDVTFIVVKDGALVIDPIEVVVTITEHSDEMDYDGKQHGVTGYDFEANTALYTEEDFTFSGEAKVTGTDAGTYEMALTAGDFENTNKNFSKVTFNIVDGALVIDPIEVVVTITEHSDEVDYDGKQHEVSGYDFESDNTLYTEEDFTFSGEAKVTGTDAGTYEMALTAGDFENTNKNFSKVTFNIVDGALVIKPIEVVVTITEHSDEVDYNGEDREVTGYDFEADTALYTEADFEFNGIDSVTGIDAGTYEMQLKAEDFVNTNGNFSKVTFNIVDGALIIDPKTVVMRTENGEWSYETDASGEPVERSMPDIFFDEGEFYARDGVEYNAPARLAIPGEVKNEIVYTFKDDKAVANYTVRVDEGTLVVTNAAELIVNITGNKLSVEYIKDVEQKVEGYTAVLERTANGERSAVTDNSVTVALKDGKEAIAKGIIVGLYPMGLTEDHFAVTAPYYDKVTIIVEDGELEITGDTTIDIAGKVIWNDFDDEYATRPGDIIIKLLADGEETGISVHAVVNDSNVWDYLFEDLPRFNVETAAEIEYQIYMDEIPGYSTVYDGYDIINDLNRYRLTIDYTLGGELQDTFTNVYYYGQPYDVASISITGFKPDQERVTGVMGLENVYVEVKYTTVYYTLTVQYVNADTGAQMAEPHIEKLAYCDNYYVESPYFEGYRASKSVVSGMMYAKDLTVTVLYSSRGIIIVDNFDVPRGASSQSLTCGDCVE